MYACIRHLKLSVICKYSASNQRLDIKYINVLEIWHKLSSMIVEVVSGYVCLLGKKEIGGS